MDGPNYKEAKYTNIKQHLKGCKILLVTANEIETKVTHEAIKPLPGLSKVLKVPDGNLTYYFGKLGKYKVAHIQCANMGSTKRDASMMTVEEALKRLHSTVVFLVGVAYGMDKESQSIGDVLVAEAIQPYNVKRIGKNETIDKSIPLSSNKVLFNRFKNLKTWQHFTNKIDQSKLIFSIVLSGDELLDNETYRNKLKKKYPLAKGGEMEGAGLYAACDGKAKCILIKGICDFGDGNKGEKKKENQFIAARASLSACREMLNSASALSELKVHPIESTKKPHKAEVKRLSDVLFEVYDSKKEKYYVKRKEDLNFSNNVKHFGVWMYGVSGCGKTNLILRNLLKNKVKFIQVNLATCIHSTTEELFKDIFYDISSQVNGIEAIVTPVNFKQSCSALLKLLQNHYSNKELIIYIEEIPISGETFQKEFAQHFFSMLINKSLIAELCQVKFILSSIKNPQDNIQDFQIKVKEQLRFIEMSNWSQADILKLIDLISKEVNIKLPAEVKSALLKASSSSPRFIKKYFRNILIMGRHDKKTLEQALTETERELNLN
jgi:nucleoside phosphorylase